MNKKGLILTIIGAVALIALAVLIWGQYDNSNNSGLTQAPSTTEQTPPNSEPTSQQDNAAATITYTNDGFSPSAVTITAGDSITVKNTSDAVLDFASDDHPTHRKQIELNVGEVAPGESKTFMIDKKGTWGYHNHENAVHTGSITVN